MCGRSVRGSASLCLSFGIRTFDVGVRGSARGHSPGLMQGRAHRYFHGLQIQPAPSLSLSPHHLQQTIYFLRDFLLDDFRRFFFCAVSPSSSGRKWQILSLTAISC
jgi:hypothetical protein